MPLCVLLWIICLIPFAIVAFGILGQLTDMDSDAVCAILAILLLVLIVTTPNLLWYKAVRDVMSPDESNVTLKLER
jgi:membrane protein YdbS with pleckstrin-like domain